MGTGDGAVTGFISNLGAFAPFAALAWWLIRDLAKQRDAALERNEALTTKVIELAQSGERTLGELTAAIKGNAH